MRCDMCGVVDCSVLYSNQIGHQPLFSRYFSGRATLVIPSDLAYGANGSEDVIPPGATLKFEVELIKVESGEIDSESIIDCGVNNSESQEDDGETVLHTLPDGTTMRLPKGVKYRMVDKE
jgi:hypothetical protein